LFYGAVTQFGLIKQGGKKTVILLQAVAAFDSEINTKNKYEKYITKVNKQYEIV